MTIRSWNVRVKLLDPIGGVIAEKQVHVGHALDPAAACVSAYAVARAEIKGDYRKRKQKLPKVHAVNFLVLPTKGGK